MMYIKQSLSFVPYGIMDAIYAGDFLVRIAASIDVTLINQSWTFFSLAHVTMTMTCILSYNLRKCKELKLARNMDINSPVSTGEMNLAFCF